MDVFKSAMSPPSTQTIANVSAKLKNLGTQLSRTIGNILPFFDAKDPLIALLEKQVNDANLLETKLEVVGSNLSWISEKFVKVLQHVKTEKNFDSHAQSYLERKLEIFDPSAPFALIFDLSATTIGLIATIDTFIENVRTMVGQLQAKVEDAKTKIKETQDAARKQLIVREVGKFMGTLANAAALLYKANETSKKAIEKDIDASGGRPTTAEKQGRLDRAQTAIMTGLVGNGISVGVQSIFNMSADLMAATSTPADIAKLSQLIAKLENDQIPIYSEFVIPALTASKAEIKKRVDSLKADAGGEPVAKIDVTGVAAKFFLWKRTEKFESEFGPCIDDLIKQWQQGVWQGSSASPQALISHAAPVVSPTTASLVHLIQVSNEDLNALPTGSLRQKISSATLNLQSTLDDSLAPLYPDLNAIDTKVEIVFEQIRYFMDKLSVIDTPRMSTSPAVVLKYLSGKLKVVLDEGKPLFDSIAVMLPKIVDSVKNRNVEVDSRVEKLVAATKQYEAALAKAKQDEADAKKRSEDEKDTKPTLWKVAEIFGDLLLGLTASAKEKLRSILKTKNDDEVKQKQATIRELTAILDVTKEDLETQRQSSKFLVNASHDIASLKVQLQSLFDIFQRKIGELEAFKLDENDAKLIDWNLFQAQTALVKLSWARLYDAVFKTYVDTASAASLRTRPVRPASLMRSYSVAAASASGSPSEASVTESTVSPEVKAIFAKLAPSQDIDKLINVISTTRDIKGIVKEMQTNLAKSSYTKSILDKADNFVDEFNRVETNAEKLAAQIAWFADKNILILEEMKKSALAGTLTEDAFKNNVAYLKRKLDTLISEVSNVSTLYKNLRSRMDEIKLALANLTTWLEENIPKIDAKITEAQNDLDKEKEKMKKAAIVKAVGGFLSSLGQGGAMFGIMSGNAYVAGFAIAGMVIGGIMTMVAGLIDGDPSEITRLTNVITQLKAQKEDMEVAHSVMASTTALAQQAIDKLTNIVTVWTITQSLLVQVQLDYKSWLMSSAALDDFLFEGDLTIEKWKVLKALFGAYLGMYSGDFTPPNMKSFRASSCFFYMPPYLPAVGKFATVALALKDVTQETITARLQAVQQIGQQANEEVVNKSVSTKDEISKAEIEIVSNEETIRQLQKQMNELQDAINRERNKTFWDRLGEVLSNPWTYIPVYGVIRNIEDAEDAMKSLVNRQNQVEGGIHVSQEKVAEANRRLVDLDQRRILVTKILATVTALVLDVKTNWQDWELDGPSIFSNASELMRLNPAPVEGGPVVSMAKASGNASEPQARRLCGLPTHFRQEIPDVQGGGFGARLLRQNGNKWATGTTLTWAYLDKSPYAESDYNIIEAAFREWERYANIKFQQIKDKPTKATIRISFVEQNTSWSLVGTDCLLAEYKGKATMNFGWALAGQPLTAAHEIGHALGFPHEHQSPFAGLVWDREAVYAWAKRTQNWTREITEHNILNKLSKASASGSNWDPTSVMHYGFPAELISGPSPYNVTGVADPQQLSETDKSTAALFYPFGSANDLETSRTIVPSATAVRSFALNNANAVLFRKEGNNLVQVAQKRFNQPGKTLVALLESGHEYVLKVRPFS